jgi:hypothetical protein
MVTRSPTRVLIRFFFILPAVGHDLVAGIEVNAIARVRQDLDHKAFELDEFFLGHFFIPSDNVLHAAPGKARL